MIIHRFKQLVQLYHSLGSGDVFVGQVPASHLRPTLLVDLQARGVRLVPSATAQLINASKIAQAMVLNPWMLPRTRVIGRRQELIDALSEYRRQGFATVVTKADRLHCGHGICKWSDLETLYSCLSSNPQAFPLVLQPFMECYTDLRVILVGEFCEAYSRSNSADFRSNLARGGSSTPYDLSAAQRSFCEQVMERASMPYAHLDLLVMPDAALYLSEMRLNGGIQGARITRAALEEKKHRRLMALARDGIAADHGGTVSSNDPEAQS